MRRLVMSLLLATSYGSAAMAQGGCMRSTEQQAFNVIGLKSSLMVAALSCSQRDQYDSFMTQFQPHILAEQHVMDGYFRRTGGHYGQAREDDYVTLLANTQSEAGITQGAVTCKNDTQIFQQVLALKTIVDLDHFAAANPTTQPISITVCPLTHYSHSTHHRRLKTVTLADAQTSGSHNN